MLKRKNDLGSSLCDKLIARLETDMQDVSTPDYSNKQPQQPLLDPIFDPSWQIFDQMNLQQMGFTG